MALPPRVLMAASKVRRVRSDAFSKNMTICRASRAWRKSSGWFLTACASSMIAATSWTVRSAMEQRSRPQRRLDASLKAVSDWMPKVTDALAGAASSFEDSEDFITTVLLPMSLFSCWRGASVCCIELQKLVQGVNCYLDVLALED